MIRSELTSPFFTPWVNNTKKDLLSIKKALIEKNFEALGTIAEMNSLAMHALMQTSWPPLFYSTPETLKTIFEIQRLRSQGAKVYMTQDAGPNIKILFQQKDKDLLQLHYPDMIVCKPFKN
jgi:diphosphomevalonate decarboxylase